MAQSQCQVRPDSASGPPPWSQNRARPILQLHLGRIELWPDPYFDCDGVTGGNPPWFYVASQDTIV